MLDRLRNDKDYYGDYGSQFLSTSAVGVLLSNPKMFKVKQEPTVPMLHGSYFHTAILEPEKLVNFEIVEASTRTTNIYKEASKGGLLLLRNECDNLDEMVRVIKSNFFFYDNIYKDGNVYEEPAIMELFGHKFKGKADIVTDEIVIDIKTTSKISDFRWSAKKYNYDSQAYLYQQFFDKPLTFYVIDKATHELGVFEPSAEFLLGGREKVLRAVEIYEKFYGDSPKEDINNFFIREDL
jgi:hypothetical protein